MQIRVDALEDIARVWKIEDKRAKDPAARKMDRRFAQARMSGLEDAAMYVLMERTWKRTKKPVIMPQRAEVVEALLEVI